MSRCRRVDQPDEDRLLDTAAVVTASANGNETTTGGLLAPEPTQPDGALIGYAWLRPPVHDWGNCWISN